MVVLYYPIVWALLHKIGPATIKKEEYKPRLTHGAAVWRPVVMLLPCSAAARAHAKKVGAFRVNVYGNCNPEKHQEDLPVQRR